MKTFSVGIKTIQVFVLVFFILNCIALGEMPDTTKNKAVPACSTVSDCKLVSEISPDYYHRGKGSPAEFITRGLGNCNQIIRAIHMLLPERMKREYFYFGATPEVARQVIYRFIADAQRGFNWNIPRTSLSVPFTDIADNWNKAAVLSGEVAIDQKESTQGTACWKMMYDSQYLYLRVEIPDSNIHINSQRPYEGDSVEFFIRGDSQLPSYWEIVLSPDGDIFTALHNFSSVSGQKISEVGLRPKALHIKAERTSNGFVAECAFPFVALARLNKALPYSGGKLELMMVRTNYNEKQRKTEKRTPVPFLYDGHNVYGYMILTLE